ncbi:hypothetical protein KVG29_02420 [Caldicoprobacter algeriensis]|uniref:hypothetical protein n=1 Tax=Caldicoprobacter algeriensis TaxID=699281 RepID=UPI0020799F33|nr:hypothetical protein [Caldicoprobacter algeriensis]MCM8900076.1 hypothetical protein [Caldicoprobacter algeriensis]
MSSNHKKFFSWITLAVFVFTLFVSHNVSANTSTQQSEQEELLNSLSFFVGKVTRSYTDQQGSITSTDFSQYINFENKTIRSFNEQVYWDYERGIITVNTTKAQGAVGFLNKVERIELDDVIITSNNEYATILIVSLDGKDIASSGKILIQAMTEEKFYGAKTENNVITDLGGPPINVKNIDATVIFKKWKKPRKVIVLDENGYAMKEIQGTSGPEGYSITLDPNSLYTVITKKEVVINNPYSDIDYIWWEAEDPIETNYPPKSHFDISTEGKWEYLSGGNWLTSDNENAPQNERLYAKYRIEVSESGQYNLWARKFWYHGPFEWRFDEHDWRLCGRNIGLVDKVSFRTYIEANWVYLGKVNLSAGEHIFEFRLLEGEKTSGMDCFMLTRDDNYVPRGHLKPGERLNLAEEGYWAYEPLIDPYDEALLDLRVFNEAVAGQSGYVRREGDRLVLGDGTPVRFWAVNATIDMDNKKLIDYMARRLAKFGVNLVRVHTAFFDSDSSDLSDIDPVKLDRLHYFVYAMKQQGIYTNISFYFPLWVDIKPEYGIPGYDTIENKKPFALLQFDEQFQEIYKEWVRKIFLTTNPYTGVPLAKEPAVAIIEIQNEDSYLFWTFSRGNIPEVHMNKLEKMFGDWLIEEYGSLEAALKAWGPGSEQPLDNIEEGRMELKDAWFMTRDGCGTGSFKKRMSDQVRFLVEHQKKFYEDMVEFFRNEIGILSLISCSNWTTADPQALQALERYTYTAGDIIDRHGYFECNHRGDGAEYSVREGHSYIDTSVLTNPGANIAQMIQIVDYPHMISETAWTNPNKYHGESVPMWSIFGALQGMDAIHFFSVGTPHLEQSTEKWPVMVAGVLGQFPAFSLIYREGYVEETEPVLHMEESFEDLYSFKGSAVFEGQALDLIRIVEPPSGDPTEPEPPVVEGPDTALFNFEDGNTHGFGKAWGDGETIVEVDTLRKYAGESSLKVTFNGPVTVGVIGDRTDIPPGAKVKYRVYVPATLDIDLQFAVFGANWAYNGNYKPSQWIERNRWVEYEVEFNEGGLPVVAVVVEIIPQSTQSGTIWIDSITYDGYGEPGEPGEPGE